MKMNHSLNYYFNILIYNKDYILTYYTYRVIIIRTFNMPMEPSTRSYLNEKILKNHD